MMWTTRANSIRQNDILLHSSVLGRRFIRPLSREPIASKHWTRLNMNEFEKIPDSKLPSDWLRRSMTEIFNFTVSMVAGKTFVGSGTLILEGAVKGILTAAHVSSRLFNGEEGNIGIVFANQLHSVYRPIDHFEEIVVGRGLNGAIGPDLAFIRISDPVLLDTIGAHKSFFKLSGKTLPAFGGIPLSNLTWVLAGAPEEMLHQEPGSNTMAVEHFTGEAKMESHVRRDGFDFVHLEVPSGWAKYPNNYGGVSGGGIWIVPISMDPNVGESSITVDAPFFSGVAYYQSAAENGNRTIICHGPESIYGRLAEQLKQLSVKGSTP